MFSTPTFIGLQTFTGEVQISFDALSFEKLN
jgi:hypothetical protein